MTLLEIKHWMGTIPPCEKAIEIDKRFYLKVENIDDIYNLVETHDVMIRSRSDNKPFIWVDKKGRLFKQR